MELTQLGWNLLTLGFIGTMATTLLQGWGSQEQIKKIWDDRKAESVSTMVFAYTALVFIATFIYGVKTKSITLMFNGLLTFVQIPVLMGISKFRGFTNKEKFLMVIFLLIAFGMVFSSHKDWYFLMISFGSVIFLLDLPWQIYKNGKVGEVSIKMVNAYLISTIFWIFYAFKIHDWVLEIIVPIYLVILSSAAILWYWYNYQTLRRRA